MSRSWELRVDPMKVPMPPSSIGCAEVVGRVHAAGAGAARPVPSRAAAVSAAGSAGWEAGGATAAGRRRRAVSAASAAERRRTAAATAGRAGRARALPGGWAAFGMVKTHHMKQKTYSQRVAKVEIMECEGAPISSSSSGKYMNCLHVSKEALRSQ